eukprot:gb/GFBE01069172.1/.p1 GENE.gb/GFBE01069172.1/~~gb/GFBE01069172.1/.p1  ORF type:complete len:209 (+),score=65.71 gb/GFBE01069172.1/:1-627(+)
MAPPSRAAAKRAAAAAVRQAEAEKTGGYKDQLADKIPQAVLTLAPAQAGDCGDDEDSGPVDLATEVAPAGKHQGKAFKDIVEDNAFCKWVCKEPRNGWMGMLKIYLETEHGFEATAEEAPEIDEEEAARQAELAAARAKLLAKGAGKGKKKPPSTAAAEAPKVPTILRIPFQATTDWQEVLPEHMCPRGLQFRMDVKTGKNYARLSAA